MSTAVQHQITVGGHPWVYAATQPGFDITPILPQVFGDMSYAGVDGIELMSVVLKHDGAVETIGELSRRHALPIIGASFGGAMWDRQEHASLLEYAELAIPRLAQLGGRTLGLSVGPVKRGHSIRKTPEQLDAQAEILHQIVALCGRHGVVPNLHNHTYEVENGLHDLAGTLQRMPDMKLGPDLNWLVRGGVEPVAFLRQYASKIVFLHLRDQKRDGRWSEALGEGDMDYNAIAAALRDIGFHGPAVIELAHEQDFTPTRPLRESIRASCAFARGLLASSS